MSLYDDEVFRLVCSTLGSSGPPGTFAHRTELNAQLLPAMTALTAAERVLPAFDDALVVRHGANVAKEIRAVCAVRLEKNRRRNVTIRGALLELGRAAAKEGFAFAALKGMAWVLEDVDNAAPWRWMIDVDVLVPKKHFPGAPIFLQRLGYAVFVEDVRYRKNFHLPPYAKTNSLATVEVHRHIGWRHQLLPPETIFEWATPIADGLVLPAPWCRAYHAFIHWQLQDFGITRATMPLKEIVEVDRFLRRADIDWRALAAHARSTGTLKACEAAIALASTFLGSPRPEEIPATDFGSRHVSRALLRKSSPWRSWIARETWRAGTLWRCDKIAYSAAIGGAGPVKTQVAVWTGRLLRLPLLAGRFAGVVGRALMMALSQKTRSEHFASMQSRVGRGDVIMPLMEIDRANGNVSRPTLDFSHRPKTPKPRRGIAGKAAGA
jgi:hypothetical protein